MFEEHLQSTIAIIRTNPLIGLGIAIVVLVLFYFRPKEMFKLTAFVLFLAAAFYILTLLVETLDSGSRQKDTMIYKSRQAAEDN